MGLRRPDAATPNRPEGRRAAALALDLYGGEEPALASPAAGLVLTPNLDHLRLLATSAAFRRAYRRADRVVNDSRFLDRLAIRGAALCKPGSELALAMLAATPPGSRIVVVGAEPAVEAHLRAAYPALPFSFVEPSMGYIRRRREREAIVQAILARRPARVFVCTGAPQSELLAAQLKAGGCAAPILCCGSAFRFAAGVTARAPSLVRSAGFEWAWRFTREPRTRARYLADAAFLLTRLPAIWRLRRRGEADFGPFRVRAARQPRPKLAPAIEFRSWRA